MKLLLCGDIVGRSGREVIEKFLPELVSRNNINFVIVNGENSASGFGITKKGADYFRPLLGKRDASDIKNYPVFTKGKLKLVSKKLSPWND